MAEVGDCVHGIFSAQQGHRSPMLRHKINPGLELKLLQPEHAGELFALVEANRSALREWLPWVGRHNLQPPQSMEEWAASLRARFDRKNRELGLPAGRAAEVFRVTAWGVVPDLQHLLTDFPPLLTGAGHAPGLAARLDLWSRP